VGNEECGLLKMKQVVWEKRHPADGVYDEARRDDPNYIMNRAYHEIEISKEALFRYFLGSYHSRGSLTQHKFSLDVGRVFACAAAEFSHKSQSHIITARGREHEFKTSGACYWRFSTQRLRYQLDVDHPELKLCVKAPDATTSLSEAITSGAMYLNLV
jgi:hypothetical protein